jgi:putative transcriptional regulator
VIRFHLARLIADKGFLERRRLELGEISTATGISRSTLSRVLNKPGANLSADNMSRLCAYFGCSLSELAEYVADELTTAAAAQAPPGRKKPAKKQTRKSSSAGAQG